MNRSIPLFVLVIAGCSRDSAQPPRSVDASTTIPEEARWLLSGTQDDRFVRAAAHFRGFDVAMVETGYRYAELAWAGRDRNWGYAEYQLGKIQTAIARGVERRPRRASSARMFEGAVASVRRTLAARDGGAFDEAFVTLTTACNACHLAERVAFIRVVPPTTRASVVHAPSEPSS